MGTQEMTLQIGDVLGGRYRIVAEGLAQDIGTLYRAYDSQYERLVAVLVLASRFASDAHTLERVLRSQQAVADLAVPALIPADDVGVTDGQLYLVRNQVDGHFLAGLLARLGPLAFDGVIELGVRLCDALAPAHRAGLVHGSLSPYSVLVGDNGQVFVTDVGLLPALQPATTAPGRPWGRAPYLSPEQAGGESVHASADVYVIGSLLYEMLSGRPPFQAQDEAVLAVRHLRQDPPALQVLVPDIPLTLAQIVHKALAKEPAARYRNASQLAHILRSQLGGQQAATAGPRAAPRPERLVVPAPPVAGAYEPGGDLDDWVEEPEGVDWRMVALIIAALFAVLGLIPLWRAVYHRYAVPAPVPSSGQSPSLPLTWATSPPLAGAVESGTKAWAKLDDFGLVCYNLPIPNRRNSWTVFGDGEAEETSSASAECAVWESRLRVLGPVCNTL
jgi:hypothetical protein